MEVSEVAPGLWRWTAGGDLNSVYCEAFGDVLLIDPLLPADEAERERFWRALDRDVRRVGSTPLVLLTSPGRAGGSGEIVARYPGASLVDPEPGTPLPGRVRAIEAALAREVIFWLPSHRALVTGDTLAGDGAGGVRLRADAQSIRPALRERLIDLPVEYILPSQGELVAARAREALTRALG